MLNIERRSYFIIQYLKFGVRYYLTISQSVIKQISITLKPRLHKRVLVNIGHRFAGYRAVKGV